MGKNVILFHMDGVSRELLWQYRAYMPTVMELFSRSLQFHRFHSASVGTIATVCDTLYGAASLLDHNTSWIDNLTLPPTDRPDNLLDFLTRQGYAVRGFAHATAELFSCAQMDIWKECAWGAPPRSDLDCLQAEIDSFLKESRTQGTPFAMYCLNTAARTDSLLAEKGTPNSLPHAIRQGFALLDMSLSRLLESLSRHGLVEETIIALFGGVGSLAISNAKFSAAYPAPPHASRSWTPFALSMNGISPGIFPGLISSVDIKTSLVHLLSANDTTNDKKVPYAGITIFKEQRSLAFSQNLPALQSAEKGVTKSYAVTNGEFRVVVSSLDLGKNQGGTELYYDAMDPGNNRNLLDFFTFDAKGAILSFNPHGAIHPHFIMSFNGEKAPNLVKTYLILREELQNFIRSKEHSALKIQTMPRRSSFPEQLFKIPYSAG